MFEKLHLWNVKWCIYKFFHPIDSNMYKKEYNWNKSFKKEINHLQGFFHV